MRENALAESEKFVRGEVVFAVVRPPRADAKVRYAKTVADMINRWKQRQYSLVLSPPGDRLLVAVGADALPLKRLTGVEVRARARYNCGVDRCSVRSA